VAIRFAKETKRSVRCMNDRREEHLVGGMRPDSVQKLTIGGKRDGTITVLLGESYGTSGNRQGGAGAANDKLYAPVTSVAQVDVVVAKDGSVVVRNATQDIGTGTKTVFAVLVAEELGIAPATVRVEIGDSRFPAGPASGGSTTASSIGPAAREAGVRAREGM